MTGIQLVSDVLIDLGVLGESQTASGAMAQRALRLINQLLDAWAADRTMIYQVVGSVFPITNQPFYTIGPGATWNVPRPESIQTAKLLIATVTPPFEIPLAVLDDNQWAAITQKTLTNAYPQAVYFDRGNPIGKVYVWPVPTGAALSIILWVPTPVAQLTLAGDYTFPPAYARCLRTNANAELAPSYGKTISVEMQRAADQSLDAVKTVNQYVPALTVDLAIPQERSGWNWKSDTFVGPGRRQ